MTPIFTAIGNACIDLMAAVDDDFLIRNDIPKGLCRFVDDIALLNMIKSGMGKYQPIPGGAGANVAHVMSALGHESHFISKIGADAEGTAFHNHMEENGVTCHFPSTMPHRSTSQILTLITPDSERTFLSFDDVTKTSSADDFDFDLLRATDFLYLDGYCFVSPHTAQAFVKAGVAVRHRGGHVTFNIGDAEYYTTQKDNITAVLDVCDSIICNMAEARVLFGSQDPDTAASLAQKMADRFLFGAITDGPNGATVFHNHSIAHVPAISVDPAAMADTNGAGDHFSAGFIYGLMNGYSLEQSGRLGILCATDCIGHTGARPLGGRGSLKHLAEYAGS